MELKVREFSFRRGVKNWANRLYLWETASYGTTTHNISRANSIQFGQTNTAVSII